MVQFKVLFFTIIVMLIIGLWALIRSCEKVRNVELLGRSLFPIQPVAEQPDATIDSSWVTGFRERECKIYSQNGEDGVLLWLFVHIGTVNHPPRFVEFGVENGQQCNTRFLRQHLKWQGLMMDGSNQDRSINLQQEIISSKNINDLLRKHNASAVLDLLSIDVE